MDYLITSLVFLFGSILLHALVTTSRSFSKNKKSKKLPNPPGPTPLPIIGHLHLLGEHYHKSLADLAKTYGPIMTLKLGFLNYVAITSPAMAKQVLQKKDLEFSGKWVAKALHAHDQYKYSVVMLPVEARWRSLRRSMNSAIFSGARLDVTEHVRENTIQELLNYCKSYSLRNEAVDLSVAAFMTTLNSLTSTIFSKNVMDPNLESSIRDMRDVMWNIAIEAGAPNLADYFHFIKFDIQGVTRRLTNHFSRVLELIIDPIDERIQQRDSKGGIEKKNKYNDALDLLLSIIDENPQDLDRTHMERLFLDLFIAGSDTTSSTLEWAMAELMKNPETMKLAKEELAQVVGKGKPIKERDVDNLPYLQCVLKETLRLHPPVPTLIPRLLKERDVELCGYTIPKGSKVIVNVWGISHDPNVWKDPLAFKPERFQESDLEVRGLDFELLPFGSGRRICPGLPFARRLLPVAIGSMINSFDWELEDGMKPEELDMEEKVGLTLKKAQALRAVPKPMS
ncbi:hypothetical protein Leryth_006475 [Lithospermum erythrorhizon]|nr:hypothetical protein Leryth_006475 [Lithospermum erythrorhizon]